jgi:hypothetical protein
MIGGHLNKIITNASLEDQFELLFDSIFLQSTKSERYFLIANKYLLRKLFVSNKRSDIIHPTISSFRYALFNKFDSFFTLGVKVIINTLFQFVFLSVSSIFRVSSSGNVLREVRGGECNDDIVDYYAGSIASFLNNRGTVCNLVDWKTFRRGISAIELPSSSFLYEVSKEFSSQRYSFILVCFLWVLYVSTFFTKGVASALAIRYAEHICYGAVIPPQKIISLEFLRAKKSSYIFSHGHFHDPQCTVQPANDFFDFRSNNSLPFMFSSSYFLDSCILNINAKTHFWSRVNCFTTIETAIFSLGIEVKEKKVLVFSSAFDPALGRDTKYAIFFILSELRKLGCNNISLKLHPAELGSFFKRVDSNLPLGITVLSDLSAYPDYDLAVGLPSTLIDRLENIPNILVYSPIEYEYDVMHGSNVFYFSELA